MIDQELPWVLAIEPDAGRAEHLGDFIREWLEAEVIVVASPEIAASAIEGEAPVFVLVSSLMAAGDRARLSRYLAVLGGVNLIPIVTMPAVADIDPPQLDSSVVRHALAPPAWPVLDHSAVGRRLRQTFERLSAGGPGLPVHDTMPGPRTADDGQAPVVTLRELTDIELGAYCGIGARRLRDHRWAAHEVPGIDTVRLAPGVDARVVNISRSGLLLRSVAALLVGDVAVLELPGPQQAFQVTGRVVRSRVAEALHDERCYEAALHFERPIDLAGPHAPMSVPMTADDVGPELQALLDHVRSEAERGTDPSLVRAAFELGVQQLVTAREVRLLPMSGARHDGCHTVCLAVPGRAREVTVLQAVFDETSAEPGDADLALLQAAASCAAEVLDVEARSRRLRLM
jgi:hypothetical protein